MVSFGQGQENHDDVKLFGAQRTGQSLDHKLGKAMDSLAKCSILFLCMFMAVPPGIVLHEVRHYVAQTLLGAHPTIHYQVTTGTIPNWTPARDALQVSAGPLGEAVFALTGLLWLYKLRKDRRESAPTVLDWCATFLAFSAVRWLRGFTGSPSNPQPGDEAFLSQFLGLPGWLLPYLLAILCFIPLVATVRLHPPGVRLMPFTSLLLGGFAGGLVWVRFLGPVLLP